MRACDIYKERVNELHEASGMTILDVAAELDKATTSVYELLRRGYYVDGERMRISTVRMAAKAYKASADYLLGLTDDPTPYPAAHHFVPTRARLKTLMYRDGLERIKGLSDALGIKYTTVYNLFNGYTEGEAHNIVKICQHFGVPVDWYIGLTDKDEVNKWKIDISHTI